MQHCAPSMSTQDISNTLWALARLEVHVSCKRDVLLAAVKQTVADMTGVGVAMTLQALSMRGWHVSDELKAELEAKAQCN